jgi:hypothetical protein
MIVKQISSESTQCHPLHDAVSNLVTRFLMDAVATGFIRDDERKCISSGAKGIILSKAQIHISGKKHQAWTKFPDTTILFQEPGGRSFPRVVFEAGFSESHDDLRNDVFQWLECSGGRIKLAVLVNIEEDACLRRRAHQQTSQFKFRAENLISKYGNDLAKNRAGIKPENPEESDADLYEDIRFEIMTTDWIGPITASLEV